MDNGKAYLAGLQLGLMKSSSLLLAGMGKPVQDFGKAVAPAVKGVGKFVAGGGLVGAAARNAAPIAKGVGNYIAGGGLVGAAARNAAPIAKGVGNYIAGGGAMGAAARGLGFGAQKAAAMAGLVAGTSSKPKLPDWLTPKKMQKKDYSLEGTMKAVKGGMNKAKSGLSALRNKIAPKTSQPEKQDEKD